jgi:hypothetical protein
VRILTGIAQDQAITLAHYHSVRLLYEKAIWHRDTIAHENDESALMSMYLSRQLKALVYYE